MNTAKISEITEQDVRKAQQQESARHGGDIRPDSLAAGMQSIADANKKDKEQIIAERQANLPLPEDPPAVSDFNSADARTVNVGSGYVQDDFSAGGSASSAGLRGPATADSAVRADGTFGENTDMMGVGRTAQDNLSGLPSDAMKGGQRLTSSDVQETRNK